jgi:anti-sigma B factor antagonist
MEIQCRIVQDIAVVELDGEITAHEAGEAQRKVLQIAESHANLILDLSRVPFMSSAGLRMLLVLYRTIHGRGGKVVLVGLSEDLQSTMSLTGFLDLLVHHQTLDAGLAALSGVEARSKPE